MKNIRKCKKCPCYSLDTLADGTKERYCHPPMYGVVLVLDQPCRNVSHKECKCVRKNQKAYRRYMDETATKYNIDISKSAVEKFWIEVFGEIALENDFEKMCDFKINCESLLKSPDPLLRSAVTKLIEHEKVKRGQNND